LPFEVTGAAELETAADEDGVSELTTAGVTLGVTEAGVMEAGVTEAGVTGAAGLCSPPGTWSNSGATTLEVGGEVEDTAEVAA